MVKPHYTVVAVKKNNRTVIARLFSSENCKEALRKMDYYREHPRILEVIAPGASLGKLKVVNE